MVATQTAARVRPATPADSRAAFDVLMDAVRDLTARQGLDWSPDPDKFWADSGSLYGHMATHAAEWWLAEDDASGELLGYARSVERGGMFELSEFFVRPAHQSAGIGRQLLDRAFPPERGDLRVIVATTDVRALRSYYRAGTAARFPIASLEGAPRRTDDDGLLVATHADADDIGTLTRLEAAVLEFPRSPADFNWLLEQREGWLYLAEGTPIGFAFVGRPSSGPLVALEPGYQASMLRHVEGRAAELEVETLTLEIPMVNEVAARHLLNRGFKFDAFLTLLMSSRPFGKFDRFIGLSPPLVL